MEKKIIDANVLLLAGTPIRDIPDEQLDCFNKCIDFIKKSKKEKFKVLLDDNYRILNEYRNAYRLPKCPNSATAFFKWVLQNAEYFPLNEPKKDTFEPYPNDNALQDFDPPDRKYIALAYVHPDHPAIVEASDSKWWGIKQNLKKHGITVSFIDEKYIKRKYKQKMGSLS